MEVGILLFAFIVVIIIVVSATSKTEKSINAEETKRYGEIGENKAFSMLANYLPDDYKIFQNVYVTYEGKTSEIDMVIVGKTGIYVVEIKHMKGTIFGNYEEQYWIKDKVDYDGEVYRKEFYNPVKQVRTHRHRLAHYLRENLHRRLNVDCAVYFVDSQMQLHLDGPPNDTPVFTYDTTQNLLEFIMSGTADFSDETIENIVELLNE